jgi:chloramphenicol-sensitive protein RarD
VAESGSADSAFRQAQGVRAVAERTEVEARGAGAAAQGIDRRGLLSGLGAYLLWGAVPLFWMLIERAGAVEILAHRIVWSLPVAAGLALVMLPRRWLLPLLNRRSLTLLGLASTLIAVNWGVYIWSVNSGHVVEAALGYYINPIVTVLLGVFVLHERLAALQWVAVGFALAAVLVLTINYGQPPWVALILAGSYATYGLLKNRINSSAVATLTVESAMLTPAALAYLIFLQITSGLTFGHLGWRHSLLLIASGLVTVLPLLLFSAAAVRIPLSTLGLLQYLTPTAQFLLGVFYFGESMSTARWVGFGLIWVALLILSGFGVASATRRRAPVPA